MKILKLKYFILVLLLLVTGLGLYFRVVGLEISPNSLNWDEASLGYNAFSILRTGRDEYGNFLPLSLRSFNDYKPALYSYFAIPFIKLLGLTQTAVRLPSALFGTLLILIVFGIAFLLTDNYVIALLSALLLAFEPWALHFSRVAFESNLACSLSYLGIFLLLLGRKINKNVIFFSGMFFLILSGYAYHSNRIILFPFLVFCLILWWRERKIAFKKAVFSFVFLVVGFIPLLLQLIFGGLTRLKQTNFWSHFWPFVSRDLFSPGNPILSFPHNPLWYGIQHFLGKIFAYFSPVYLFFWGSKEPSQYVPTLAIFHSWEMFFWLLGWFVLALSLKRNKLIVYFKEPKVVLAWIFICILPAAVTWNWFSSGRSLNLYPFYSILTATGIYFLGEKLTRKRKFFGIIFAVIVMTIIAFSDFYLINTEIVYSARVTEGEYQPGGFKDGVPYLKEIQDKYDEIIIDTPHAQPHVFFLFYQAFPPEIYQQDLQHQDYGLGKTVNYDFYKYHFRKIYWPDDKNKRNTLFWGSVYSLPKEDVLQVPQAKFLKEFKDVSGYTTAVFVELK